jgi:V-type H+-transporting ATPase subunit H
LAVLAKSSDTGHQDIAIQFYSNLLRTKQSREIFWSKREDTVAPLIEILRSAGGFTNGDNVSTLYSGAGSIRGGGDGNLGGGVGLQLLYHILLVIWQLSFEGSEVGDGLDQ